MKFKSGLVTQVSGSFGGMTGSHNAGGLYFRARSIPVNTNTIQQQVVRNLMSQLTSRWVNTLTQAQRDAWSVYASLTPIADSLGDARPIPPLAMYVRSNIARGQVGLSTIDDGPTTAGLPTLSPVTFTAMPAADTVDVAFDNTDAWAIQLGGGLTVFASRPQNQTINFFAGPYRLAGVILGATVPPTSPANFALPFPIAPGQRVFFQVRALDPDGRVSSPFRGSNDT